MPRPDRDPAGRKSEGREKSKRGGSQKGSFIERARACARTGVALFIRQSSDQQKENNTGSPIWQRAQIRVVEPYMAEGQPWREYDARGESAKAGADRPVFRRLLEDIRAGQVGIVVVAWADRTARNSEDGSELFDALEDANGMLVSQGQFYDPSDANHKLFLKIQVALAEHANEQRRSLSATSKGSKAANLSYRMALPTGLVWGSPDDPAFVEAMNAGGYGDELTPEALARHRVVSPSAGKRYFIFRHPDPAVRRASALLLAWMRECRSLSEVLRRTESSPEWPQEHRGALPIDRGWRYRPNVSARWVPLRLALDRRGELHRGRLHKWFRSPALYGIYHFQSEVLKEEGSELAREMGGDVWSEDAFPSYAPTEALEEIDGYLRGAAPLPRRGAYTGPDCYRLAEVRCSHPLPDGRVCGLRRRAWPRKDGRFNYVNPRCSIRGHHCTVPVAVETTALALIEECYTADVLGRVLDRVRRREGSEQERVRDLERSILDLSGSVQTAADHVDRYTKQGKYEDAAFWEDRRSSKSRDLELARTDLDRARRAAKTASDLAEGEFQSILRLATDIPELIRRAGGSHERMRRLTRALTEAVHVRQLGEHVYFVEVEFPSGQRRGRIHYGKEVVARPAARLLAHARLGAWLEPANRESLEDETAAMEAADALAEEINAGRPQESDHAPWTGLRLLTAALQHASRPGAPARRGQHETVDQLSSRIGVSRERVLWAATCGDLGPARLTAGELCLRATPEEIHRIFPDLALRLVAAERGWPVEDVILIADLCAETGISRGRVEGAATRGPGIARDAYGRCYTTRTGLQLPSAASLEWSLREHLPSGIDPESGEWVTLEEARARMPGVNYATLCRHALRARPGQGQRGAESAYFWIDEATVARLRAPTLAEAVAGLGRPDLRPEDFISREEAVRIMRENVGYPHRATLVMAGRTGRILQVSASTTGWGRQYCFVHLPEWVRTCRDRSRVAAFLQGREDA